MRCVQYFVCIIDKQKSEKNEGCLLMHALMITYFRSGDDDHLNFASFTILITQVSTCPKGWVFVRVIIRFFLQKRYLRTRTLDGVN